MKNQKGFAGIATLVFIVAALSVGLYFQFGTKHVDSAGEQIAEKVLAHHGIEIDFSENKKNKLKGE